MEAIMAVFMQNELINQAKEILITRAHVTEDQAHRFLQKRAMNLRISKVECATQIIERYNRSLGQEENQKNNKKRTKAFAPGENTPSSERFSIAREVRS